MESTYYQRGLVELFTAVRDLYSNILALEEVRLINLVLSLPSHAQRLLFRLLLRKDQWLRVERLEYRDIPDLQEAAGCLAAQGLLLDETTLSESDLCECLTIVELKSVLKELGGNGYNDLGREQLVDRICKMKPPKPQSKLCIVNGKLTSSSPSHANTTANTLRGKTGKLIRLQPSVHALWEQCAALFLLNVEPSSRSSRDNASTIILASLKRVQYPSYEVNRTEMPFADRQAWLEYQQSVQLEARVHEAIESDCGVDQLLSLCLQLWRGCLGGPVNPSYFLRRYQPGWVHTRSLTHLVGWLESADRHAEAIDILRELLAQDCFCWGRRGLWWERIVLDTHRHLKDINCALKLCEEAIRDPHLRTGHLLSLTRRARKLRGEESVEREIEVKMIEVDPVGSRDKLRYLLGSGEEGRVEEMVLEWMEREEGWTGWHSESSLYTTIFALCFWDILFTSSLPNVFLTPFQSKLTGILLISTPA